MRGLLPSKLEMKKLAVLVNNEDSIMQENKWLSMKEVCDYLHISRDTVVNWIKKEGMPAHQKGRLWRFDVNEIDKWMKTNEESSYEYIDGDAER